MHVKTVTTEAGEIAYVDEGEGPVALFVHGVFLNHRLWADVIAGVSDLRRCIAVDLPAHGSTRVRPGFDLGLSSLADTLEGVCQALDLGAVDLVGNDTGGAVCQVLAARHPERLRTLTLTNCDTRDNLPPENFKMAFELACAGQLAPVVQQMAADPELARGPVGLGAGYEHPEKLTEEKMAGYLGGFRSEEAARELERCIAAMDEADLVDAEPGLKGLDVPTLLVWGMADTFFTREWATWLRETIPGAAGRDVVEIEGAKLFFPDERAPELVAALRQFWRT